MSTARVTPQVFEFLRDLSENNHRDWFQAHKDRYEEAHATMIGFADELLAEMRKHDHIETPTGKKSLMRIYRDVRFSKNKSPYKIFFGGGFRRATVHLRGGYYYHLQPDGNTFVGGGFWGPNKEDLLRIRQEFAADDSEIRAIVADPRFVENFGELKGEELKTAPKGFDRDHPAIDLIRKKQFLISRTFTDKEALSAGFVQQVSDTFQAMRPFFDYMSEVLTTDANGVSIV